VIPARRQPVEGAGHENRRHADGADERRGIVKFDVMTIDLAGHPTFARRNRRSAPPEVRPPSRKPFLQRHGVRRPPVHRVRPSLRKPLPSSIRRSRASAEPSGLRPIRIKRPAR
jgi:hypothetical protein